MNYFSLILFVVFTSFTSCFSIEAPIITSLEQVSEREIKLKWTTNQNYEISRYRIFFTDNSNSIIKEWPNQMEKSDIELKGYELMQSKVNSTFACYLECIKNVQCQFAEFRNYDTLISNNCFLKSNIFDNEESNIDDIEEDNNGREFYKLKKYTSINTNEVIIKDLPPNNGYVFYVSVYDEKSGEWSPKSEPSKQLDIKIEITLTSTISEENKVTVNWEQTSKFKNYKMSRYNLKVWLNNNYTESPINYPIKNEIRKHDLTYSYYDLAFTSLLKNDVQSGDDCFEHCLNDNTCIRYIYFYNGKRCYLLSKVNLLQSVYKAKDSELEGLESSANSFEIPLELEPGSTHAILLEFKTLDGLYGISKKLILTIPKVEKIVLKPEINANHGEIIKKEGENVQLSCKLLNGKDDDKIEWEKLNSDISFSPLVDDASKSITSNLEFNNLKRNQNGTYRCSLNSDSTIYKDIHLFVYGKPSRPVITNVLIKPDGKTYIKWEVNHIGGVEHLRNIIVSYSADFKNVNIPVRKTEVFWNFNGDQLDRNEVYLDVTIPEDDLVTLELENNYGISEKAIHQKAECEFDENCPGKKEKKAESIEFKIEATPALNTEPVKSNKTTMILISLIGVIVLIIIIFIVYQSCQKKKPVEKVEYEPVPKGVV